MVCYGQANEYLRARYPGLPGHHELLVSAAVGAVNIHLVPVLFERGNCSFDPHRVGQGRWIQAEARAVDNTDGIIVAAVGGD